MIRAILVQTAFFATLAFVGAHVIQVAAQEQRSDAVTAHTLSNSAFFSGLESCEIPGLHERIISGTQKTVAFAGEFRPTASIPWAQGRHRVYLYVVSGAAIARFNGTKELIRAGDFIVLPSGTRHAVSATTPVMRAIYVEERG